MSRLALFVIAAVLAASFCAAQDPLDDYVNAPDPTYTWSLNSTIKSEDLTGYVLRMTSQTWLTANDSSCPVWHHWIVVCVPNTINFNTAFMYIDGGSITDGAPTTISPFIEIPCLSAHTITAHLMDIPNEPITFADGQRRTEDAIIAYTWDKFMNDTTTTNPVWLLQMAMTKAAVRALDTLQAFSKQQGHGIENFVVAGASKRGWVTWLTGAVDKRVSALVPVVMPILNMSANMNHHWQAYGYWSFALSDYLNMHVMRFLNQPPFDVMAQIIDPFNYRDRLTVPKYLITACGDEFFLPDSPRFFWSAMLGQKYLRVVPNAEHTLMPQDLDIVYSMSTYYYHLLTNTALPQASWEVTPLPNGHSTITVHSSQKPSVVKLWKADTLSAERRDFRLIICGDLKDPKCIQPVFWFSTELQPTNSSTTEDYVYEADMSPPAIGWSGYLVEMEYDSNNAPTEFTFKQTSEVYVVPDTLPYPPCGNNCQPSL